MPAPRKYNQGLHERAQRMVREAREQEQGLSLNAAVKRIGPRVGINPDTLRRRCKQAAIDAGEARARPPPTGRGSTSSGGRWSQREHREPHLA